MPHEDSSPHPHPQFLCYLEDFSIELLINKSNPMIWDLALVIIMWKNPLELFNKHGDMELDHNIPDQIL